MDYELYEEVALVKNLPKTKFKKGDIASIVDINEKDGKKIYTIEFFSSLGDSFGRFEVEENFLTPLRADSIPHMRIL